MRCALRHALGACVAAALPAVCCGATLVAQVRTSAGAPVADAVVYVSQAPAGTPPPPRPSRKVPIEQIDREFVPYVSAVQTGTIVTFPNRDPIRHHVYSFSHAKTFEIKLYSGDAPSEIVFDRPGVVTLGCNVHDWMIGYVLVVDTPHFAKTDAKGSARLADLPPGEYVLDVWHPTQNAAIGLTAVHVAPGPETRAEFVLDFTPRKPRYKPPLDKMRY